MVGRKRVPSFRCRGESWRTLRLPCHRIAGPACILLFGALTQICSVLLADCYIIGERVQAHWWVEVCCSARQRIACVTSGPQTITWLLRSPKRPDGKINNTYSEVVAACFSRWAVIAIGV